jgi:hypothetical protein
MRCDRKIAAMPANDFNIAPMTGHMAGYKFCDHAIGNLAQFETVAVANHEQQADYGPEKHCLDGLRQTFAKQCQDKTTKEDNQDNFEREPTYVMPQQIGDGVLVAARDQGC